MVGCQNVNQPRTRQTAFHRAKAWKQFSITASIVLGSEKNKWIRHTRNTLEKQHTDTQQTQYMQKKSTQQSWAQWNDRINCFFFWYFCCGFQAKFNSFVNLLFRFRLVLFYLAIFSFLQWLACSIAQSFDFVILLVNRLRAIDCSYVCVSTMNVFCFYGVSNGDVNEFFSGRLCLHFIW